MVFVEFIKTYYETISCNGCYDKPVSLYTERFGFCTLTNRCIEAGQDKFKIHYEDKDGAIDVIAGRFVELATDKADRLINAMTVALYVIPAVQMFENLISMALAYKSRISGIKCIRVHEMDLDAEVDDLRINFKDKVTDVENKNAVLTLTMDGCTKEFKFSDMCWLKEDNADWLESFYIKAKSSYLEFCGEQLHLAWVI